MDRSALSGAIIQEMESVMHAALEEAVPHLLMADLTTMEQQAQRLGRVLLGRLIEAVVSQQDQALPRPLRCATCGGAVRTRSRPRQVQGLVGDYRVQRSYHWCAGCGRGWAPLDEEIGLGPGVLSPGLARVVARAALEAPFSQAVDQVQEALGVAVSCEVVRRTAEEVGAVAEASVQGAIARARQGQPPWVDAERQSTSTTALLAVELDGVLVQRDASWHEMKVVTVAPLGPQVQVDAHSGRAHLAWGAASYGAGVEGAEDFWWRAYVEAVRRGLGTPAVRTVVVLGDGAAWIWERAATFLGVGGTEVVEIVDIYHAYGYLWAVGNAVFGTGSPQASAWVELLKDHLYEHGPAPVLAALARLTPQSVEAEEALHAAQSYFATHAARMDYPTFVARCFPIGSGAVESCCKCLIAARAKQAGMRWSTRGLQHIASLRALQRSGRWGAFWQTHPHRLRPQERTPRRPAPTTALPAALAPPLPPSRRRSADPHPPCPRPKPTARQRPLILPRSA